jgi:hypothetical protein
MKTLLTVSCFALFVLSTAFVVNADIAKPKPQPKEARNVLYTDIEIVPDAKATNATLQIRESDIKEFRAALDGNLANPTIAASITNSRTRTIIAGVLLFMSVSFAGVWLARSSRMGGKLGRGQKAVALALIGMATIGAAAIITRGNAGPPPSYRWRGLASALAAGQSTAGPVILQVVPDDQLPSTGMKLTIPLKKPNTKGEDE